MQIIKIKSPRPEKNYIIQKTNIRIEQTKSICI